MVVLFQQRKKAAASLKGNLKMPLFSALQRTFEDNQDCHTLKRAFRSYVLIYLKKLLLLALCSCFPVLIAGHASQYYIIDLASRRYNAVNAYPRCVEGILQGNEHACVNIMSFYYNAATS